MDMPADLTGFDWIVITLVGLLALSGLLRGFTKEAFSLAGWIAGGVMVRLFHEPLTGALSVRMDSDAAGATVAFLLLFFGTVIAVRIVAGFVSTAARASPLGPLDRVLGLGFGAAKGVILAAILFLFTQFTTGLFEPGRQPPAWLIESRSAPLLGLAANAMVGWIDDLGEAESPLPPALLPPDHPPIGPEMLDPRLNEGGYSEEDRRALDELLNEAEKRGEGVEV
jgi:membrane protein required for colicin V production